MSCSRWIAVLAAVVLVPMVGHGEEDGAPTEAKVWGALIYAGEGEVKGVEKPSLSFEALKGRPAKVFKTEKFTVIAQHQQKIFKEYESWVVPSKELYLKIDSRGPVEGGGTKLDLQVWQDDKVLAKTDAVLKENRPLFVGGPKWRGGRLIFVVMLE